MQKSGENGRQTIPKNTHFVNLVVQNELYSAYTKKGAPRAPFSLYKRSINAVEDSYTNPMLLFRFLHHPSIRTRVQSQYRFRGYEYCTA